MHCRRIFRLFTLSKEVSMCAHMFSERTGICIPFVTSWHFTDIRFVLLMRPDVFESVTRVRVGFTTAREWTNIWFLTYNIQKQKITLMDFPIIIIWASPLSLLGVLQVNFNFYLFFFFYQIPLCQQNSPRWDATFCGFTSGAILFAYVP